MSFTKEYPTLVMRLRSAKALKNGERVTLSCPPIINDGALLIPEGALTEGMTARELVTLSTGTYASGISGAYINLDSTGIILIDTDPEVMSVNHDKDKAYMMRLAAKTLFDVERLQNPKAPYAPATSEERAVFKRISEDIVARFNARGNRRPYMFTSQDYIARLRELYRTADGTLALTFKKIVDSAHEVAGRADFKLNEGRTGLADRLYTKLEEDFYDYGGRNSFAEGYASRALEMALAYLLTDEVDLALKSYYTIADICLWKHWGPGHFLNCAGAAALAATTYDWMVDSWRNLGLDTDSIIRGIYRIGVYEGWRSLIEDTCTYPSKRQGTGWRFKHKPDNWNAVCMGGLIIATLAMLGEDTRAVFTDEENAVIEETLGASLAYITAGELVLMQYSPDGSYVESNSYWAYGSSALFRAISAIYDALGTDLGITLSPGLDKTCYYALNSESPDFVGWNYHDGHTSSQDTSLFNIFATVSGDDTLYAIRDDQIANGKGVSIYDLLYHPQVRGREIPKLSALPLDCFMEGIDAFVVHGGWDKNALYVGVMGGYNPIGGSHNQLDSGSYIYHRYGVRWISDLGSDNYNLKAGYFGNYHLYRRNAEGANVVCLPSIKHGQGMDCSGRVIRHRCGEGAYAIIDNAGVYEGKASSALRGMLLSPDRETLVIQDEISFVEPTDAHIISHFKSSEITAALAEDKRSCILTHKDGKSIKLSLVGEGEMRILSTYDFLLPTTVKYDDEQDRSEYSRIVISYESVTEISASLVIEPTDKNGYTAFLPMQSWK